MDRFGTGCMHCTINCLVSNFAGGVTHTSCSCSAQTPERIQGLTLSQKKQSEQLANTPSQQCSSIAIGCSKSSGR